METLFLGLIGLVILLQFFTLLIIRIKNVELTKQVHLLYASIARDLNSIVSTIAVYTGQTANPLIVPPGDAPGEGLPVDPVESARRKAELWRAIRYAREGGRK